MMIQSKLLFRTLVIFVAISMSTIVYAKGFSNYYGDHEEPDSPFIGAVYAMSNNFTANTVVGYGRSEDGKLTKIGEFRTGGEGAAFDGGEGLDPLISAYSIIMTDDRRFLLAVNAGSSSVSVFRINSDFSLELTEEQRIRGGVVGPNSIAYRDGLVYVSVIDSDGIFDGEPDQEGALVGFRLTRNGKLRPIARSTRELGNRPSAVRFSPDGKFLIAASINAGSSALASGSQDEMVVYGVRRNGRLTRNPVSAAASTVPLNSEGRNLPSAIGFEVVRDRGKQFVVVTEAREFQSDGSPPAFPALQTGSISTWELDRYGRLIPIDLDVLAGTSITDGERTACWIQFAADGESFWVSNALESTLSSFSFDRGNISLINRIEAAGTPPSDDDPFGTTDGWIDLWVSEDGLHLYQLFGLSGTIGVYEIENEGEGTGLTLIQTVSDLPDRNTQGIVAF